MCFCQHPLSLQSASLELRQLKACVNYFIMDEFGFEICRKLDWVMYLPFMIDGLVFFLCVYCHTG